MGSIQSKLGNSAEFDIAQNFKAKGYWAYILPKKIGGQPFDIIACKNDTIWMVDAKHLEQDKASFAFARIEPNQRTSMRYAREFAGIKNLGFVIESERDLLRPKLLTFDKLIELEAKGEKSVKLEALIDFLEII